MAKTIYFHNVIKNQAAPVFIKKNFWKSIGADVSKKRADSYYYKMLGIAMAKGYTKTEIEILRDKEYDLLAKESWEKYSHEEKTIIRKKRSGSKDKYRNRVNKYPPQLQKVARLYFETFEIELNDIPIPSIDKKQFAYWCKDFGKIKVICGKHLSSGLVRTKRNYVNRHKEGFELDHPGTIFKILKSAMEEIEMEMEAIDVPDTIEKGTSDKSHLAGLRNIFNEE